MFDDSRRSGNSPSERAVSSSADGRSLESEKPARPDWKQRWATLSRLGCVSELVEADIFRLRALAGGLHQSTEISSETTKGMELRRIGNELAALDETFEGFARFMTGIRRAGFTERLVDQSFSDPLYRYFASPRTLLDFQAFKLEVPLEGGYTQLYAWLFCQEIGRYVAELLGVLADPTTVLDGGTSLDDVQLFVEAILDPLVYLPSSEWVDVIHLCRGLVDSGVARQDSFLDLVQSLVERSHPTDAALDVLCEACASLRGPFEPDQENALFKLGGALATKRHWGSIFERPRIDSHPIVEFGYYAELLHRAADFSVEDPLRRKALALDIMQHHAVALSQWNESAWFTDGVTRTQAALIKIMEGIDSEFAIEALQRCCRVVWRGWDDLGLLWRGATVGVGFGERNVQHVFLRYLLQDPHAVAALKGILAEATTPLGATYHLVGGLREVIRDRWYDLPGGSWAPATCRALELLAHTGDDGMAAAPEVLGLLGISAYAIPLTRSLISPPWPSVMGSHSGMLRRARALIAQWEKKHGPLSPTISRKLARYDKLFAP